MKTFLEKTAAIKVLSFYQELPSLPDTYFTSSCNVHVAPPNCGVLDIIRAKAKTIKVTAKTGSDGLHILVRGQTETKPFDLPSLFTVTWFCAQEPNITATRKASLRKPSYRRLIDRWIYCQDNASSGGSNSLLNSLEVFHFAASSLSHLTQGRPPTTSLDGHSADVADFDAK
uniref:Uncharacterized protein n=1 Tax=Steinernema glaseri TaxID=37863 RepID=A0A1I7YIN5_9BILA